MYLVDKSLVYSVYVGKILNREKEIKYLIGRESNKIKPLDVSTWK